MSKILVIEPYRLLQQAIARSFFPDHEVKIAASLPESGAATIAGYDVVIVDAAGLREKNGLTPEEARGIQSWPVPIIWLESEDQPTVASGEKLVVLQQPIERESLFAALARCLGRSPAPQPNGDATQADQGHKRAAKAPAGESAGADQQEAEVIELVDVVEAEAQQQRTISKQNKK